MFFGVIAPAIRAFERSWFFVLRRESRIFCSVGFRILSVDELVVAELVYDVQRMLPPTVGAFLSPSQIFISVVGIVLLVKSTYQVYKAVMFLQCLTLLVEILAYNNELQLSPRELS